MGAARDRAPRRPAAGGPGGADRRGPRGRPARDAGGRAHRSGRAQPGPRAAARPAHARALPLGPPDGGARRLPRAAPAARRGARARAVTGPARARGRDAAPGPVAGTPGADGDGQVPGALGQARGRGRSGAARGRRHRRGRRARPGGRDPRGRGGEATDGPLLLADGLPAGDPPASPDRLRPVVRPRRVQHAGRGGRRVRDSRARVRGRRDADRLPGLRQRSQQVRRGGEGLCGQPKRHRGDRPAHVDLRRSPDPGREQGTARTAGARERDDHARRAHAPVPGHPRRAGQPLPHRHPQLRPCPGRRRLPARGTRDVRQALGRPLLLPDRGRPGVRHATAGRSAPPPSASGCRSPAAPSTATRWGTRLMSRGAWPGHARTRCTCRSPRQRTAAA